MASGELSTASKSSPTDPVSEADLAAERTITARLAAERPHDGVLGEEGSAVEGSSGLRWVIDPLDGTTNFLYGIPHFAVSVACEDADGALAGVVYDPLRDELWSATRSGPPMLGDVPLVVGPRAAELGVALIGTGFGYRREVREGQAVRVARLLPQVREIRRLGSAALDLAWTAAGRYDAYYEHGMQPWDTAAAALICRRAGLELHELPADPPLPPGLLAAPSGIAGGLVAILA